MKNHLLFDFTVDKTNRTILVNREFDAPVSLVWDAFTKQEILDQWWAPKPWTSRTKFMNFERGGRRFYAMVSPDGEEFWSVQTFTSISPITNYKMLSVFTDKDENINTGMPGGEWDLGFCEENGKTKVTILIKHPTLTSIEKLLAMNFQGGLTMILNFLEELLITLSGKQPEQFADGTSR